MRAILWFVPLASVGCVISVPVGGGEQSWTFDAPEAIHAAVASGSVIVDSSGTDEARVDWVGGGVGENAQPVVVETADAVAVDADGGLLGGGELTLSVPDGTALVLWVNRGSINLVLDAPSDIDACVRAGDVHLSVPPGPYELDLGIGIGGVRGDIWHEPGAPHRISVCVSGGGLTIDES